jgi:hypothetical protein
MAGRPLRRAMIAEIERRARAHFEDGDEPQEKRESHLQYLIEWVQSGGTILELANKIATDLSLPITRQQLDRYIRELAPDAAAQLAAARTPGAHAMVDRAIDIVDSAKEDRDAVRKAQAQANVRTWVAERWNRKDLGAPKGPAISVSINTMHLDALRRRASANVQLSRPSQPALPAAEDVSFELEEG